MESLPDDEFRRAVEQGTLASGAFRHRDHLRLAWIYVREAGPDGGIALARTAIRAFAAAHGADTKYHETLTAVWIRLVAAALRMAPAEADFEAFLADHPDLLDKALPGRFYTPDLLASERARLTVVEPDVAPLP